MYTKRNYAVMPRTISGFLDDVFQNGWSQLNEEVSAYTAPVNIQETDKSYELHIVAAGYKKEDFKLNLEKNMLQVSVEQKEDSKEGQEGKWIRNEYRRRSFKRSFTLNEKVDTAKIAAKYADGILVVTLPKKEVSEPTAHEITVN
ncbi:MAG: heat-shock protein [Flavipsychrobacter sp.]|jgi:HSP20 family protein|nr:heat-shock protein [Flavipsychrobacter sp.]